MVSYSGFDGVSVARCLVDRCLLFFLLTIVLSILVRITASDCPLESSNLQGRITIVHRFVGYRYSETPVIINKSTDFGFLKSVYSTSTT
jgi:hypothetical protein